jgi:proteasome lid subunit RPN8/RPN11
MRPVHRARPLPEAAAIGRLVVAEPVIDATAAALRRFAGRDGRHEGIVLWLGRTIGPTTLVMSSLVPDCDHSWGHVAVSAAQVGAATKRARTSSLGIVAQVHSHPGDDVRHSDGDDDLILMPFHGMYSIVVGRYGDAPVLGEGVHQFQNGRWHRVTDAQESAIIVPAQLL